MCEKLCNNIIEIKNLSAGYDGKNVINNINFNVKYNENLSIIGPNGCGKTTLLRVLAGVLSYKGEVIIDGVSLKKYRGKKLARKISMLSQITNVYFNYSVIDTVLMGRFAHQKGIFGTITEQDRHYANEAIKMVGLSGIENHLINNLSGGQIQRVFLAKTICQNPDIVLLDEPTNHLDLSYQAELMDFLLDWSKKENKCLIGVMHDLNLAMKISDNMLLMNKGDIISHGSCKEIISSKELTSVYNMDVKKYMLENLKVWKNLG